MANQESTSTLETIDFLDMRNIVLLAAFAAEARRVLTEIEGWKDIDPILAESLNARVAAGRQWTMHEDAVPEVLEGVARKLEGLAGLKS